MANTFKLKTKPNITNDTLNTVYTVPGSTTAIVLGLNLCNKSGSEINANVQVVSDTSDTETNATVLLLDEVPIPNSATLEVLSGQKVVLQATDVLKVQSSANTALDAALSIMEIT